MCLVSFSKTTTHDALKKFESFTGTPTWAYIELTDSCTHKCAWCYGGFDSKGGAAYISVADFALLCDKLHSIGIHQITLSGGEPTEHPEFIKIVELSTQRFRTHIATHGEFDSGLVDEMARFGVSQVQFNYQGSANHDRVHGVPGAYRTQVGNMRRCMDKGIEVVGTLTVAAYNFNALSDIFEELDDLRVTRIRVWESTGFGNAWRKGLAPEDIFNQCASVAAGLGYTHIHSYDPDFIRGSGVPCIPLQKLYMYITTEQNLIFCGAVPSQLNNPIADFKVDSGPDAVRKYLAFVDSKQRAKPYCMAREELTTKEEVIQFHSTRKSARHGSNNR